MAPTAAVVVQALAILPIMSETVTQVDTIVVAYVLAFVYGMPEGVTVEAPVEARAAAFI
jgi:hypothetical protein